ncbi:general stress protein [Corynebacterium sp. HS2168-gen11]|uniref:general stress protein n=1 Tax=Corynebacterium sp. HS2168-gen11 TaxID=2974027 RepID=UPI00216AFF26|nr:general stress protein [Corynebacterium sp. HS2168-gen11]MCS4534908.1 magnesium transporter [Corynebacterium sp. HS2168-gen11]
MAELFHSNPTTEKVKPHGWPIGTFEHYETAQQAVQYLDEHGFDVTMVSIVGLDLMEVHRILGKLNWLSILVSAALTGAAIGAIAGIGLSILQEEWFFSMLIGIGGGIIALMCVSAIRYVVHGQKPMFVTETALVAQRYEIICESSQARKGREILEAFVQRV